MENDYRLNDYVYSIIQTKGLDYVIINYLDIRELYYQQKQQLGGNKDD